MRVKYTGESDFPYLTNGKEYELVGVEKGPDFVGKNRETDWYRVITDIGDDYVYLPDEFEIIEE